MIKKICYDHLVYFVAICFILWQFVIFFVHLLHYPHFGILYQEKSGNPAFEWLSTAADRRTLNQAETDGRLT
jgi:hypothetical protein